MSRLLLVSSLLLLLPSATAAAQGGVVMVMPVETIEGELELPEAYYVLSPSQLEWQSEEPVDSFLPELLDSVTEGPL